MSQVQNTELIERAANMIDFYEGKLPARIIETDLNSGDLEALRQHVLEAENAAIEEYHAYDPY